jgi:hypothetical protein
MWFLNLKNIYKKSMSVIQNRRDHIKFGIKFRVEILNFVNNLYF